MAVTVFPRPAASYNEDKVVGPASATDLHVAVFDGTTGKLIKDSGYTIEKSVPSDAKFTDTTYSEATSSTYGLVKTGYTESGKNYPVALSDGQMYVNVPWTDTSGSDKVAKAGDTMTGNLKIQGAGERYVSVQNTNTSCVVYMDSDSANHGVYSSGYWNGSSYTANGKWLIYRGSDGTVTANGNCTGSSGSCTGNSATCTYPIGFSARNTNATWGDQTGATVTSWNEADGGSIDFRKNNPSSGKLSIKVDGRFYGNEGSNPAMLMNYTNGYWGIGTPDGNATDWIRLSNNGVIPYQGGSVGSGHGSIGTSTWFFSTGYIDTVHSHQLIVEGATTGTMTASSTNPRITFQENTGTQPVHLIYSDWDSYRSPAGLKVIGGSGATPAWFEVEGNVYATTFVGALSGNATTATTATSASLLYYTHTNEINFLGGRQANCYFNWRNAADDSTATRTQCTYYFGSYGGSTYSADGIVKASKVYNAVWNDYAECRKVETLEPGRCVTETESGTMVLTAERLQPGCRITSDTFGACMGETDEAKTPIAVAGRVLVYPFRDRKEYHLGDAVCSAPNGTVDVMTREEIKEYPERIVGTVSEIPKYDTWKGGSQNGDDDIKVNGRIWVYVR